MKRFNLTGLRQGMLLVLKEGKPRLYKKNNTTLRQWLCQCDCGKKKVWSQSDLRQRHKSHCGCKNEPRKPISIKRTPYVRKTNQA